MTMICVTVVRKDVLFLLNVLDLLWFLYLCQCLLLLLSCLMFCGLYGEINGRDYVCVYVIYFDVYNFVSVVGVLFVAHL